MDPATLPLGLQSKETMIQCKTIWACWSFNKRECLEGREWLSILFGSITFAFFVSLSPSTLSHWDRNKKRVQNQYQVWILYCQLGIEIEIIQWVPSQRIHLLLDRFVYEDKMYPNRIRPVSILIATLSWMDWAGHQFHVCIQT